MGLQSGLRILLLTLFILSATVLPAAATQPQPGGLFIDAADSAAQANRIQEAAAQRERLVRVNFATLGAVREGGTLTLNLFNDRVLTATISEIVINGDTTTWVGDLDGSALGQVFLVESGGQIAADVVAPEGMFQVRSAGDWLYTIAEIDDTQYPPEMEPLEAELHQTEAGDEAMSAPAADNGSAIDVLVLYTAAARSLQGGTTPMLNLINLAVLETNQSYANSGVNQRINLVRAAETAYAETGNISLDLDRLRARGDGFLDEAHTLRDAHQADLVMLINNVTQYCGMAYQMDTVTAGFRDWAFSVVARTCAAGYFSFAHELGHNMGARHDWFVDASTRPSSYSHGYVSLAGRWRTIMAYDSDCSQRGFTCTRLQYWANPALHRGGLPMGVYAGTNIDCQPYDLNHPPCDADDHRTLNDTAYTVANFRVRAGVSFWDYPHNVFLPTVIR